MRHDGMSAFVKSSVSVGPNLGKLERAAFHQGASFPPFLLTSLPPYLLTSLLHDRHLNVTGPSIGCTIAPPVRRDSIRLAFSAKYHFAGRSASSISINRGLCFNPSACRIIVSWSWRRKILPNILKIETGRKKRFHAATKSIRQRSRRTGVTVARLENHILPL